MEPKRQTYRNLLRNRSFLALWLGQTVSFVGDYFYWLAIPIMVERLTGSAFQVGLSIIASALPMLLLGPVAGVFVDRWDRKRTMIVSDLLRALLVLVCLAVQRPEQVWILYVVAFLMSCVSRFFFPSQNATLPLIVRDEKDLLAANGLMQIVQTVGFLVGPALAGFSIALWGAPVAFAVDSASFVVSALGIWTMTVPHTTAGRQAAAGSALAGVWSEMRDGMAFLLHSRTLRGILLCLAVVQLGVGAINVLWVPFMQRAYGLGAEGLGAVDMAQGIGMVVGGVALGFVAARVSRRSMAGWGIVIIGVMIALMGVAPAFSAASLAGGPAAGPSAEMGVGERLLHVPLMILVYSILLGVALVPAQAALGTMMQLAVPDLKRGRVGSALNALVTLAGLVSMAAAAGMGEGIGLEVTYVIAGAVTALAGVVGLAVLRETPAPAPEKPADGLVEPVPVVMD